MSYRKHINKGVNDNGIPYTNWDEKAIHQCDTCGTDYQIIPEYRMMTPCPTHHEGSLECMTIAELRVALSDAIDALEDQQAMPDSSTRDKYSHLFTEGGR